MTAFCLRPWREMDAVSLVRYADDPGIAANLRDVFPAPIPGRTRNFLSGTAWSGRAGTS